MRCVITAEEISTSGRRALKHSFCRRRRIRVAKRFLQRRYTGRGCVTCRMRSALYAGAKGLRGRGAAHNWLRAPCPTKLPILPHCSLGSNFWHRRLRTRFKFSFRGWAWKPVGSTRSYIFASLLEHRRAGPEFPTHGGFRIKLNATAGTNGRCSCWRSSLTARSRRVTKPPSMGSRSDQSSGRTCRIAPRTSCSMQFPNPLLLFLLEEMSRGHG